MIQIIVNSVLQLHTTSGHGTEGDDKTFERPANRDGLATGKQLRCDWRGRGVSSWKCFFSGLHWPAMTPFVLARFLHWIATGWCIRYRSAKASTGPRVDVCRRNVIGATFIEVIHLVPPFVRSISDKFLYLYISLVRGCSADTWSFFPPAVLPLIPISNCPTKLRRRQIKSITS